MISIYSLKNSYFDGSDDKFVVELRGLSTDDKPTTINGYVIGNGSQFIEIDTGKIYLYNEESEEWGEI